MRRVVLTGIGMMTPVGNDAETTWSALLAGKSGAAPITLFDASQFFDKRELKHLDRFLQFGVAAGLMAMNDAGLDGKVPAGEEHRWGSYIGAGLGGVQTIENTYKAQLAKGPRHGFSPYFVTDIIINEV